MTGECEQCGTVDSASVGGLCPRCAFRQADFDERRDTFAHLGPSTFGFAPDEYWGYDD
jgi:hypothetical protein